MTSQIGRKVCSNDAADPAIILDPMLVPFRVSFRLGTFEFTVHIRNDVTSDKDIGDGLFPIKPILVRQTVAIRETNDAGEIPEANKFDARIGVRGFSWRCNRISAGGMNKFSVVRHGCLEVSSIVEDVF